jgi:Gas vesicle synthesis protein GvpL/GvpF
MSSAQPQSVGSYLYCVTYSQPFVENGSNFQAQGIEGRPVRVISESGLAALVSDSPYDQYDITLANVTAHESVVEAAMQRADVLPVSFGTVAGSDEEIRVQMLKGEADVLRQQLEWVKNRVELGVKALWDQGALFSEIAAEDSTIQELGNQIAGTTPEETYDLRIQLGELTDAAIQRKREQDAAAILDALSPLAVDTRTNQIITDLMIVNASFLVDKPQVQAFTDAVRALQQSTAGRITIQFVGPLPPYNFISVVAHWEEPSWEEPSNAVTQ